jgi:monoamine oxidase
MSVSQSRRQFLKTAPLAAGGMGLDFASHADSASAQSANIIEFDCCVVGAGYAGLTAALRLQQVGRSVAVLEARDRVGGRIWSAPLSDGTAIDIGGHWVGPTQRRILALAQEMQVPIFESFTAGKASFMDEEGKVVHELPANVAREMEEALGKLDAMAAEVPLETPWLAPQAAAWDMETIGSWIADNVKTPYVRDLLAVEVLGSIGPVAPEQSLLWALFAFHAAGGLNTMLTDEDAQAMEGGAQAVALKVAAALGDSVHLNSPVRKITQDARGVEVTSDSMVVRARRVIVTVPRTLAGARFALIRSCRLMQRN